MPLDVLVCGATGYLGKHLVRTLGERGHRVRALARREQGLASVREHCHEVFVGQATQPETLEGLAVGMDVVVSCLGNRTLHRKPTVWEVDEQANKNIVARAREAGVEQFIFISALSGEAMRAHVPQLEARERVVDMLEEGGPPWTIIRPSGFFNDMEEFLGMAKGGSVWIPGDGHIRFNPIHGADLAAMIADHVGDEASLGRTFPAGGPDVLSMREIAALALAAWGHEGGAIHSLPTWTLDALAGLLKPFNVNVSSLVAMFAAMIEGDQITDAYGSHRLEDFYRQRVAELRAEAGA